jgi:hypothetical protein
MKTTFKLFILVFLFTSCSLNRYFLTDKGNDKRFLVNTIKKSSSSGEIQKKPIIVVDGTPYRYDYELKSKGLPFSKNDIKQIDILKKDVGIKVYGDYAKDGVILVTTKSESNKESSSFDNSNVLILLENKEITRSKMEGINPNDIESIEVFKDKDMVKKYTSQDYDGVIVIHLKETN